MRKLFISLFAITLACGYANSQDSTLAQKLAQHIALKMKDTLELSPTQQNQLYWINMNLHETKLQIRESYSDMDSLRVHIQLVENTRDSLYQGVLEEQKFLLYRQRKQQLISSN